MSTAELEDNYLLKFKEYLVFEERAAATIEKYERDIHFFFDYLP